MATPLIPGLSTQSPTKLDVTKRHAHQKEQMRLQSLWEQHVQNRMRFVHYKRTVVMTLSWKDSDLNNEALQEEVRYSGIQIRITC
jgi:ribosomal protein L11 methylase PrmA